MISLIHGHDFDVFKAHIWGGFDTDYTHKVLQRHHRIFGPFPDSFREIADAKTMEYIGQIIQKPSTNEPYDRPHDGTDPHWMKTIGEDMKSQPAATHYRLPTTYPEICAEDRAFALRIMKLDPRDRPTAKELLQDVWFDQDGQSGSLEDETCGSYSMGVKVERG